MLLKYDNFKLYISENIIEIIYEDADKMESLEKDISELKKEFPLLEIITKIKSGEVVHNDIDIQTHFSIKKNINKELSILVRIREKEEKINKKNVIYKLTMEIVGKNKYLKGIIFSRDKKDIEEGEYYIVKGEIEEGDSKFIKKNELALGKTADYQMKIKSLEQQNYQEKKKHYEIGRHELHCHTFSSKNDAFITPEDIAKAFDENKLEAVAITDHGIAFSFLEFVNSLKKYSNSKKLILGVEFYAGDIDEYKANTIKQIHLYEQEKINIEESDYSQEAEEYNTQLNQLREAKKKEQAFCKRKTISEQEREQSLHELEVINNDMTEVQIKIKMLKERSKDGDARIEIINKEIEYLRGQIEYPGDMPRDHLTVLVKSDAAPVNYHGEEIIVNKGLVELYKLITKTYQETFSAPERFKKWGKRPVLDYKEIFNPEIRDLFIINSACAFGKHMKLAIEEKWEEFDNFIKQLDSVELHPIHNNIYMIHHEDYPTINSKEDLLALHRKIYERCKKNNVKVIFASDAHVNDKNDRIKRSIFKEGYITSILKRTKEEIKGDGENDFGIEKQPYIMSYDDVVADLTEQGFNLLEIEEIHNNAKELADSCANALLYDVLPNKLFIPDFPDVDTKIEVPRLAWEFAIEKWSKDGTKDGIEPRIKARLEEELLATSSKNFEVLYYISYFLCKESRELGYEVGSRGSAGSMILTYCLRVGENNPLEPHYLCNKCKNVEWVETDKVGLDLPDKQCECGETMFGDGLNIESHNFVGYGLSKIPDIDLNFASDIQTEIHNILIQKYGSENVIKSGTQMYYQTDKMKKDVFGHIPNIQAKVFNEEFCTDYYADNIKTMASTGSHPGGLLIKPRDIPFEYVTPLVYISDDFKSKEISSAYDYHSIESQLLKIDALGHGDPATIKELEETTGFPYKNIRFNDPDLYKAIHNPEMIGIHDKNQYPFPTTTIGISEMNTDFTMQMMKELNVSSFTDLIYFSGLSHGTNVYNGNIQKEKIINDGYKLSEVIPVRDIIYQHLHNVYKMDPKESFDISEDVRKGKGIKKWLEKLKENNIPTWMIECMSTIKYLFPKAHAASYILMAMRIFYYKIHYPTQFYTSIINRYGMSKANNANFDFEQAYALENYAEVKRFIDNLSKNSDNSAKIKDNIKIVHIIWEMKLRGIKISHADFSSHPTKCIVDDKNPNNILMPLQSIKGIGEKGAEKIHETYVKIGKIIFDYSIEELSMLKTDDGKKAFGKKELNAFFPESQINEE